MKPEQEPFALYVDRIRDGNQLTINELFPSALLFQEEEELKFPSPVSFAGTALLSEGNLILQFKAKTDYAMPCSVCNAFASHTLETGNIDLFIDGEEFKSGIYFFDAALREAILLEIPQFKKCGGEKCLDEEEMLQYIKREESKSASPFDQLPN